MSGSQPVKTTFSPVRNASSVTTESIKRYGGSTAPTMPWPEASDFSWLFWQLAKSWDLLMSFYVFLTFIVLYIWGHMQYWASIDVHILIMFCPFFPLFVPFIFVCLLLLLFVLIIILLLLLIIIIIVSCRCGCLIST